MNNKDLHKLISDMDKLSLNTPLHQRRVKRALVNYRVPEQTFFSRVRAALDLKGVFMEHKKTLFGSGVALTLLAIVGVGLVYGLTHTPRALAEQVAAKSISLVKSAAHDDLAKIEAQFGGDPTEDLKKAKQAKDLKVISQQELDQEVSKSGGMIAVTLDASGKPSVFSGSFEQSGGGKAAFAGGTTTQPAAGGATGVFLINGKPETGGEAGSTSGPNTTFSAPGGEGQAPGCVEATHVNGTATTKPVPCSTQPQQGAFTSRVDGTTPGVVSGLNGTESLPQPAKYLRYTDGSGHAVILGLDAKGVPIRKITLMTSAEVQKLAPHPGQ